MMGDIVLSKYQQDILDYYNLHPHDNIFINALAGSGKSYTLLTLLENTTTSDIYVAFNNSIAKEFQSKIKNPKLKAKTLHSVGYSIMQYNVGANSVQEASDRVGFGKKPEVKKTGPTKIELDNLKSHKIVDELIDRYHGERCNFEFRVWLKNNYVQLYMLCRNTVTSFDNIYAIQKLIEDYNLFSDEGDTPFYPPDINTISQWLQEIHRISTEQFNQFGKIDFADMLYITWEKLCSKEWSVPGWSYYTNIAFDECMPGDTKVMLSDYSAITLEELYQKYTKLEKLPYILSLNSETLEYEKDWIRNVKKVGEKEVFEIKTYYSTFIATANHRIHTAKGYEYVSQLKIGDLISTYNTEDSYLKSYYPIISMRLLEVQEVYDIEVGKNHSFLCSSDGKFIVSHNCQDATTLQLYFIKFIKRKGGRYVFCGDSQQAIYYFASSNANNYEGIKKMFAPVKEFDLPICYRCPTSHLKRVNNEFAIPILPRDNAPEGFIKTIKNNEIKEYIQPGDMIISRKNKYLPEVILQMSIAGIPIYIEDKDFVDRVKKIAKKTKLNSLKSLENNINKSVNRAKENILNLETFQKETEGMTKEEQENLAQEKAESNSQVDSSLFLLKIIDSYLNKYPMASVEEFRVYLDKLLNTYPRPDAVRICSIHKAKGLEADNVFVLNEAKYEYLPFASPEQNQQEKNLSYIATTRARNGLYLVKLSDLTQEKEDKKKAHSLEKILNKKKAQKEKGRK